MKVLDTETFFNGKVKRKLVVMAWKDLVDLSYNPEGRLDVGTKLQSAIADAGGVLIPPHVWDESFELIDGHGRKDGAKNLGLTHTRAYLYKCDESVRDQLFRMLNVTQRPFTGAQRISVELNGGLPMSRTSKQATALLKEYFSEKELNNLIEKFQTPPPTKVLVCDRWAGKFVDKGCITNSAAAFKAMYVHMCEHQRFKELELVLNAGPTTPLIRSLWNQVIGTEPIVSYKAVKYKAAKKALRK